MIRITEISKDDLCKMLERFSNDALIIACAEGEPYDEGVKPHVHVYLECRHSESWIRKQIQNLDKNRKSNQLYSMKKAHEQSPNYILKNYYNENENRSRIWFQRNCSMDIILIWKQQHEKYMAEVEVAKVVRKKSHKSFSRLIIEEIADKRQGSSSVPNEILVDDIILFCKQHKHNLPTRSQMEMYILNIRVRLGNDAAVRQFYLNYFRMDY